MKWEKWTIDNLPPSKTMVLIVYKSGYKGAIEFFYSEESREMHKKGMQWYLDNPGGYDLGPTANSIQELSQSDPITHWALFPELPTD